MTDRDTHIAALEGHIARLEQLVFVLRDHITQARVPVSPRASGEGNRARAREVVTHALRDSGASIQTSVQIQTLCDAIEDDLDAEDL